jgi:hypothetical protein
MWGGHFRHFRSQGDACRFLRRMDGKELYYIAPDGHLMAAELKQSNGSLKWRPAAPCLRSMRSTEAPVTTLSVMERNSC